MAVDQAFAVFAAVLLGAASGANDGATLVSMSVPARGPAPILALGLLLLSLVAAPALVGVHVASTLATGVVSFPTTIRATAVALGVIVSIAPIFLLSRHGVPTSLTVALVGSLAGIGSGLGITPNWQVIAWIVALGLIAPAAALVAGRLVARPLTWLHAAARSYTSGAILALCAYGAQVFAYGANDGQRLSAALLASGLLAPTSSLAEMSALMAAALAFAAGALVRTPSMYRRLGRSVLITRREDAIASQLASATVVLSGAAVGAPLSMTQSSAAALIGAGLARGRRRVRWGVAKDIALAWVITLPAAFGVGMVTGLAWSLLTAIPSV